MMADLKGRILVLLLFTELVVLAGSTGQAAAQERTPLPEYTGDRVYVKDVPGSYQSLNETIKQLERSSPQSYFVVVVRSAGPEPDAATRYVDELSDTWSKQARDKGSEARPGAIGDHPGGDRRTEGCRPSRVVPQRACRPSKKAPSNAMIEDAFIPLARKKKYRRGYCVVAGQDR